MSTTHVAVFLLSLLSFVTTFVGVAVALWLRESARAIAGGIGFSAGIMILISLLELLPESKAEVGLGTTLAVALAGAALVGTVHLIVSHTHLIKEKGVSEQAVVRSASLVAFGLILHDVPEVFAMATAYVASPDLGLLVAVGIALHNLPDRGRQRALREPRIVASVLETDYARLGEEVSALAEAGVDGMGHNGRVFRIGHLLWCRSCRGV